MPEAVAAIDIGTNSVRLLVLDGQGVELERQMRITRLGQGVDATRRLDRDAMARTLDVLGDYAALMAPHAVRALRMTATSAARDATNRAEFFSLVQGIVGQEPELLSGAEEARLSFAGATAGLAATAPAKFTVFDIGGGSTEFARGSSTPERFVSLDVGGVRVTERQLHDDPPTEQQLEQATAFVHALLAQVEREIEPQPGDRWIGLAGTVTSFAAHAAGLSHYDAKVTHGFVLEREHVVEYFRALSRANCEQRRAMLVEPKRADVIVGGAVVLDAVMAHFGLASIVCSERDILDGLAESLLG